VSAGTLSLTPVLPSGDAGAPEPYTKLDAMGAPIAPAVEEWVYSWFGTAGELEDLHTRGGTEAWTVSGGAGPARLVAVVRDLRGGVAWVVRDVVVGP
jgi:hypothetical protein